MSSTSTTVTYGVAGMSCQHCVDSVTAEVSKLDGVQRVEVDLTGGTVAVTSGGALERDQVRDALDEAGFDLVDDGGSAS